MLESPELSTLLSSHLKVDKWKDIENDLTAAAVGAYVEKRMGLLELDDGDAVVSGTEHKNQSLQGYEKLADFIEDGLRKISRSWPQDRLEG